MARDMKEDHLCGIFAEGVRTIPAFATWLLSQTKFKDCAHRARLLHEEQVAARTVPPERWWRHWWWRVAPLGKDRETDVFLAFKDDETDLRFVLHVENKLSAEFEPGQAASYGQKAAWIADHESHRGKTPKRKPMPHTDWQNILIAPAGYRSLRRADCDLFDVFISHEEIAAFLPEFGAAKHRPEGSATLVLPSAHTAALSD